MLEIRPITLRAANAYVGQMHRHNIPVAGCKFAVSVVEGERLCGVAVAGRPVARKLDDGLTLEIIRVCTDGTHNACSILYGACSRCAKEMGYKRVVTYTLVSEPGSSLKAAGFKNCGEAGGYRGMYLPVLEKKYRKVFSEPSRSILRRRRLDGRNISNDD